VEIEIAGNRHRQLVVDVPGMARAGASLSCRFSPPDRE